MGNIYTDAYDKNLGKQAHGQPIIIIKPIQNTEFLPFGSMIIFSAFLSMFLFIPVFFLCLFTKSILGFILSLRIRLSDGVMMGGSYLFTLAVFPTLFNIFMKLLLKNLIIEIYKNEMVIIISLPFYYYKKSIDYSKINEVIVDAGFPGSNYNFSFVQITVENGKGMFIPGLNSPSEFVEFVKTKLISHEKILP